MSLRALRAVLRAALRRPNGIEVLAVGGAFLGLTVASVSSDRSWLLNAQVLGSLAVIVGCQHLLHGVLRQNHPHWARLMPVQRQSLQWALQVLSAFALLALTGLWALTPEARPVMLFIGPILLWLSACVTLSRPLAALALPALSVAGLLLAREAGWSKAQALWVGIGIGITLLMGVMPLLVRQGDERHMTVWRRWKDSQALLAVSLEGGKLGAYQGQGWFARLMAWWLWPTRRLLNQSQVPVRSGAEALRRAQWVLSPSVHGLQQAWMLLSVGLPIAAAALLPFAWRSDSADWGPALNQGLVIGLAMWLYLLNLGGCITEHWSTRGEQSLLRLVPTMPQNADLQRGWARVLRQHAVAGWVLHAGVALLALAIWQPGGWLHALAAVLLMAPAAALLPLHRWERQSAPRGTWMAWTTVGAMLAGAVAAWPLAGGPSLWLLSPLAWLGALALAWRWRRHAPVAPWPVGRVGPQGV